MLSAKYFEFLERIKKQGFGTDEIDSEQEREAIKLIIQRGDDYANGFELTLNDSETRVKKYLVPVFKAKVK